jgi:ATP-dependent Zn protease
MMILVFNLLETSKQNEEMIFSDFSAQLQQGQIAEVTIQKP